MATPCSGDDDRACGLQNGGDDSGKRDYGNEDGSIMVPLTGSEFSSVYDNDGMGKALDGFAGQCEEAIGIVESFSLEGLDDVKNIVVCGMGGSAMAGDIAGRFARIPVYISRNYTVPPFLGKRSLLVAISYSGNTAESLSAFDRGIDKCGVALCISSGGELARRAEDRGVALVKIPSGYQPRAAMGYLALPLIALLSRVGVLREGIGFDGLYDELEKVRVRCGISAPAERNEAKSIAGAMARRIPLIYGTSGNTDLVAMRWKTQVNENAKQAAFWNVFPELNHNEIVSLTKPHMVKNTVTVMLTNSHDLPENLDRMSIMKNLLAERDIPVIEACAGEANELSEVLAQIYLGDYVSYYLALLNEVDPSPVALIEGFKRELARKTDERRGAH